MVKPPPKKEVKDQAFIKMIQGLKDLKNPKFTIKNTDFSIVKLPPMNGFDVSEEIRINLVTTADKFDAGDGSDSQNVILFTKAIMGLPTAFVKYLMVVLFEYVEFKGKDVGIDKSWAKLKGLEDMAFQGFEIINIYEVLARALFVNFSGSFSDLASSIPGADLILKRFKQKI